MKISTYKCDRCGGDVGDREKRDRLDFEVHTDDTLKIAHAWRRERPEDDAGADLCEPCVRSLVAWWRAGQVKPSDFRVSTLVNRTRPT